MAKKKKATDDITATGIAPLQGLSPVSSPKKEKIDDNILNLAKATRNRSYQGIGLDSLSPEGVPYNAQGLGDSMFDPKGVVTEADIENLGDIRAENQPWYSKLGAGLGKMVTTAASTFLNNTAGLLIGASEWARTGEFSKVYDNEFSNAMQDFSDEMEKLMPNYYTRDEQENPMAIRNLISTNFLGDKLIKNLGFVVGTIYSGNIYSSVAKGIGSAVARGAASIPFKIAKAARATGRITKGQKYLTKAKKTLDIMGNISNDVTAGVATGIGAIGESSLESLQAVRDFKSQHMNALDSDYSNNVEALKEAYSDGLISESDYNSELNRLAAVYESTRNKIDADAISAGNLVFAINMPTIWAADAIWLGKIYKRGFNTEKRIARENSKNVRRAGETLEEGYETKGFSKLNKAWQLSKSPLAEGTQEWVQEYAQTLARNAYGNDVTNYYKAALDGKANKEQIDWTKEIGKSLMENFNQQSGEAFLLGALTSVFGAPLIKTYTKADGGIGVKFSMEGNMFSELNHLNETQRKTEATVQKINERLQDPNFRKYWKSMARHKSIQEVMDEAIKNGDKFLFENSAQTQLNSDIELFHSIGRVDDLIDFIDSQKLKSEEEAFSLVQNTTSVEEASKEKDEEYMQNVQILNELNDDLEAATLKLSDAYKSGSEEKIEQAIEERNNIQNAIDQVSVLIENYTPGDIYSGPFVDKDNNRVMSEQEVIDTVNNNVNNTINTIKEYGYTRSRIDSLTNGKLSSEGLGFLTNMAMSISNAQDRMNSMYDESRGVFNKYLRLNQLYLKYLKEQREYVREQNEPYTGENIEDLETILNNIDTIFNKTDGTSSAYNLMKNHKDVIESMLGIISKSSDFTSEEREVVEGFMDFFKLGERADSISSTLDDYINHPEKVEAKLKGDIEEALSEESRERVNAHAKNLENVSSREDYEIALEQFNGTYEEHKEARGRADANKVLEELEKIDKSAEAILEGIKEDEELPPDVQAAIAQSLGKSVKDAEDYDTFKGIINDNLEKALSQDTESSSIDDLDEKIAKAQAAVSKALEEHEKNLRESERLSQDPTLNTGEPGTISTNGKDTNPTPVNATSQIEIPSKPAVPIVDVNIINSSSIYPIDAPETSPVNHYIRCTREIWKGTRHRSEFNDAVDAQKQYSEKYKKKIKEVHSYLINKGAYDYINNGKLSIGDKVTFVVDPELNDKAGCTVVLMAVKTGDSYQIIGDLPVDKFPQDVKLLTKYPGLRSTYQKVIDGFKSHKSSDLFISNLSTTVNQLYIGQIESDKDTKGKPVLHRVSDIFKGKGTPILGVVKNNLIAAGNNIDSTDVQRPLTLIEGCAVILLPNAKVGSNGGYNIAYATMDTYDNQNMDPDGINPIIDDILERLVNAKDNSTIGSLLNELSNFIYAPEFRMDLPTNDGYIRVRNGDRRVGVNKEDTIAVMKQLLEGSPLNLRTRAFGKNLMGKSYEERMSHHMKSDLTVGSTTMINNWFSVNPLDDSGIEKKGDRVPSTRTNPGAQIPLYSVSINNVNYKVDLDSKTVMDENDKPVTDKHTVEVALMEAFLYRNYGDAMNGANLVNGVIKTKDGRFYDRKVHDFIEDPSITAKRLNEEREKKERENDKSVLLQEIQEEINPYKLRLTKAGLKLSNKEKDLEILASIKDNFDLQTDYAMYQILNSIYQRIINGEEITSIDDEFIRDIEGIVQVAFTKNGKKLVTSYDLGTNEMHTIELPKEFTYEEDLKSLKEFQLGQLKDYSVADLKSIVYRWEKDYKEGDEKKFKPAYAKYLAAKEILSKVQVEKPGYNSIQEILNDLKKPDKPKLTKDDKFYELNGRKFARVTSIIPDEKPGKDNPFNTPSHVIGNAVDMFIRDYFEHDFKNIPVSRIRQMYPMFTESNIKDLMKWAYQIKHITFKDLHFIPKDVTVFGEIDIEGNKVPVAGTLDLLAYDDKGNFYIFDMKTVRKDTNAQSPSYHQKWKNQLSIYQELFEQMYGKGKVKALKIIPFYTPYPAPVGFRDGKAVYGSIPKNGNQRADLLSKDGKASIIEVKAFLNIVDLKDVDAQPPRLNRLDADTLSLIPGKPTPTSSSTTGTEIPVAGSEDLGVSDNDKNDHSDELNEGLNKGKTFSLGELSEDLSKIHQQISPGTDSREKPEALDKMKDLYDLDNGIDEDLLREKKEVDKEVWDEQKEKEWMQRVLPQLSSEELLKVQKGLIKISDTKEAYGRFRNGIITIADDAARGTLYHEAFHSVSHTLMDRDERDDMYNLARQKWGRHLGEIELEELLAEDFREYTQGLEYSNSFVRFFKNLWNIVRTLGGNRHTLSAIYYRINKGKYAQRARLYSKVSRLREVDISLSDPQTRILKESLTSFFKKFGMSLQEVSEYKEDEPLFNALDRIIYYKDVQDLTDNCGYAIAYMMQYSPVVKAMIKKSYEQSVVDLKSLRRGLRTGNLSLFNNRLGDKDYEFLDKTAKLKVIGSMIAEQLRLLYSGQEVTKSRAPFMDDIWKTIDAFFDKLSPKLRTEYDVLTSFASQVAYSVNLGDVSLIKYETKKPGTEVEAIREDVAKALIEHPKEEHIISVMSKNGIALAGSTSIAVTGIVMRPPKNPFHDLDFSAVGFSKTQIENILNKEFGQFEQINEIDDKGNMTYSYLIIDRPFISEQVPGISKWIIKDKKTNEVIGTRVGYTKLEMVEGVHGQILDFFTGKDNNPYPNIMVSYNGKPYLMSHWKNSMMFKVKKIRIKDLFDFNRYVPFDIEDLNEKDRAVKNQRDAELLRNAKIIWGHPAIGKTTYLESNDDIVEWDDRVNKKRNDFIYKQIDPDNIMDRDSEEYKEKKRAYMGEEWRTHPEYIDFLTREWNNLKKEAEKEGKRILASPAPLLELFADDFDAVVALPYNKFIPRNMGRGGSYSGSVQWKYVIDAAMQRVSADKIVYTDKYFSDFMEDLKSLGPDSYNTINQFHAEKSLYYNLTGEDKTLIKELGFTEEEWNMLPQEIREQKLVCRH